MNTAHAITPTLGGLEGLSRLMRSRTNRYAWYGLGIGLAACLIATVAHAYLQYDALSLDTLWQAQTENPALWLLDLMPMAFVLWGQYIGMVLSYQASALVIDETRELHERTRLLSQQLESAQQRQQGGQQSFLPGRSALLGTLDRLLAAPANGRLRLLVLAAEDYEGLRYRLSQQDAETLLLQMRRRIEQVVDDPEALFHLGNDRFAVVLRGQSEDTEGRRLAARLIHAFDTPVTTSDGLLELGLSIGAAHAPRHGQHSAELLRHAEAACHLAVANGRDLWIHGAEEAQTQRYEQAQLLAELYGALHHEGLSELYCLQQAPGGQRRLRLQPEWLHPRLGPLAASAFMDLPTRPALLHLMTGWQLGAALGRLEALPRALRPPAVVRLSARSWDTLPLLELIPRLLQAHDLEPHLLLLEIPASVLFSLDRDRQQRLSELRACGLRLGLVGQGLLGAPPMAALQYALDEVRLPGSWLSLAGEDPRAERLLKHELRQWRDLGLQITLSGANDTERLARARVLAPDFIEGRALQPPVGGASLERLLVD